MNIYKFFNPRITSLSLDDLDMSNSTDGTEVSLAFNYDTVYIDTGIPMKTKEHDLAQLMSNAKYPMRYNSTTGGTPLPANSTNPFGTPTNGTRDSCSPAINTSNPPNSTTPTQVASRNPVDDTSYT